VKIHNIVISAFSNREDAEKTKQCIAKILPSGSGEKIKIEEREIEPETDGGIFVKSLREVKVKLTNQKLINDFLKNLLKNLDTVDREKLKKEIEKRMDDNCNFYIRLSKDDAMNGIFTLQPKDPIHVKIKVATFPVKKEAGVKVMGEILDGK